MFCLNYMIFFFLFLLHITDLQSKTWWFHLHSHFHQTPLSKVSTMEYHFWTTEDWGPCLGAQQRQISGSGAWIIDFLISTVILLKWVKKSLDRYWHLVLKCSTLLYYWKYSFFFLDCIIQFHKLIIYLSFIYVLIIYLFF